MLKMALLDCAINEKCCSFDGRTAGLFDISRVATPGNLPSKAKKMLMPWGQPVRVGGGGGKGGFD